MEFYCRLGSPSGDILEGVYVADDEENLRRELEKKGLFVLSLRPRSVIGRARFSLRFNRRVKLREFIVFNQELATLLAAGMPVVQSLDLLRQRTENRALKIILDDVYARVKSGAALSEAFEPHGGLFSGVYMASVMSGEKSGSLVEVLRRYVAYAKTLASVRRRTTAALTYPLVLLVHSLVVVGIVVLNVVPVFGDFYEGFGAELPLATRIIVTISEILRNNLALISSVLFGCGFGSWFWFRDSSRRVVLHRLVLALPAVGSIVEKVSTSQVARTLATLLKGGIPLVTALDVASGSVGNQHLSGKLATVSREVREGRSLSTSLADLSAFPSVAIKMVEVGESTGSLQEMLGSVADFFDEEIESQLSRIVSLMEPMLLIVMGIVIAGLLVALYMPLIQLGAIV